MAIHYDLGASRSRSDLDLQDQSSLRPIWTRIQTLITLNIPTLHIGNPLSLRAALNRDPQSPAGQ